MNAGRAAAVLVAAGFIAGCAAKGSGGSAIPLAANAHRPVQAANRVRPHGSAPMHVMMPRGGRLIHPDVAITENMIYNNGSVQISPVIYVVFWGMSSADPDGEAARITSFLGAVGGTSWLRTETQYTETGGAAITNPSGQLAGTWNDNTNPVPAAPTQAQIAAEAVKLAAYEGVYSQNAAYVVVLPHAHSPAGFGTAFCAYHSATTANSSIIPYVAFPYNTDKTTCGKNIINSGTNGTLDGVSIVLGHEVAETQTDLWPNTGWADAAKQEVADKCEWTNLQNTSFGGSTLGTDEFPTQPLWSNASAGCTQSYSAPSTTNAGFSSSILADAPSAYYRLDETSGVSVVDSSGNARNGTAVNPNYMWRGLQGLCCTPDTAYGFGSAAAYIKLPTTLPKPSTSYTITALVGGSYSKVRQCIVDFYGDCFGINLGYVGWGKGGSIPSQAAPLSDGVTHFVSTTVYPGYKPAVATVSVDGGPDVPANISGLSVTRTTLSYVNLGAVACGTCKPLNALDEVAIYPSALSSAQVSSLASAAGISTPAPSPAPTGYPASVLALSPLAYYRLNDATGSAVADSSGHEYAGVVHDPANVTRGYAGMCCSPDTSYWFKTTSWLTLPANLPAESSYTVVGLIGGLYATKQTCILDYGGSCFGIYHGYLGWGKAGMAVSQIVHLTDSTTHFVALTFTAGTPAAAYVSVDGGSLTAANPKNTALTPATASGYYVNYGSGCAVATCWVVNNIDELAIFNGTLSQSQISSLATAAGY
ncbi:MAG TPA: hypothetical protein VK760_05680 [Candidatus Acidoferrales bacterium]|nr:hypothetical protein [Candidatus Acidoferrales bacterium]